MILRLEKGVPLTTKEMDNNISDLNIKVSLDSNQDVNDVKSFTNLKTSNSIDLNENSNRLISTQYTMDRISVGKLDKILTNVDQTINDVYTFSTFNTLSPLNSNNPELSTNIPNLVQNIGKCYISQEVPINPDSAPLYNYWIKLSTTTPRTIEQVYKHNAGNWDLGLIQPIHQYHFSSSSTGFNDRKGSLNWTNYGLTLYNGYVLGNGTNQYALLNKNTYEDRFYTFSAWVQQTSTFQYYKFIIGTPTSETASASQYQWFMSFYSQREAYISSGYGNTLSLNTWYNFIFCVNLVTRTYDLYLNGSVIAMDITWSSGHTGPANGLQLGGFSGFSSYYAQPARIASLEIYDKRVTGAEAMDIYQKGMYPL